MRAQCRSLAVDSPTCWAAAEAAYAAVRDHGKGSYDNGQAVAGTCSRY